ncbi:uncharacterized protein LOC135950740 [Calliphora vicina]|uniref:uncharacterized protein LOC135950740 n=1 Tax=Calliphora vicina TaxID=7373 RepID=UPI00325BD80E
MWSSGKRCGLILKTTKKKISDNRKSLLATGGGPFQSETLSPLEEMVDEALNLRCSAIPPGKYCGLDDDDEAESPPISDGPTTSKKGKWRETYGQKRKADSTTDLLREQEVWRSKIDWDEEIPNELMNKWTQWVNILPKIQQIKIPRCYLQSLPNYDGVDVQLHTFVDASKDGYAAVCYFRLIKNKTIFCSLIGSKTRVAPMKITSVPRLELMAALIGARFAKFICDNHKITIKNKLFWSNSKTVLSWINSDHRKYNQFVAFRVTEILEISSMNDWRWTPTKQNVADEATKWARIPNIFTTSRWFQGPEFLYQLQEDLPGAMAFDKTTTEEMVHKSFKITFTENLIKENRFSKWTRMLRATAYVFRFIENCKMKNKIKGELNLEELLKAEIFLFQQAQVEKYAAEISLIKSKILIPKSSELYTKSPFMDENGVLRIYGRIDNANVAEEQKRPVILPKSSYITTLIIHHFHSKYYHINHETVINEIRQKY